MLGCGHRCPVPRDTEALSACRASASCQVACSHGDQTACDYVDVYRAPGMVVSLSLRADEAAVRQMAEHCADGHLLACVHFADNVRRSASRNHARYACARRVVREACTQGEPWACVEEVLFLDDVRQRSLARRRLTQLCEHNGDLACFLLAHRLAGSDADRAMDRACSTGFVPACS